MLLSKFKNLTGSGDSLASAQNKESPRERLIEDSFDKALKNCEFTVWVQPKHNAYTGEITGGEALVRWQAPEDLVFFPSEFISVFEKNGNIVRLDEYIFRKVCQLQRELLDEGHTPLPISVNVSRATLYSPDEVNVYYEIAREFDLPMELVPLELTESAAADSERVLQLVRELKDKGFLLHMDDFGSGYSSLACLGKFPFDLVKLDKAIIDNIGDGRGDEIIKHTVEISHFFNMEVVAEGVESQYQLNFLKKIGCDTVQGYYFNKPMPYEDYLALICHQEQHTDDDTLITLADMASKGSLRITNDLKLKYLEAMSSIYMTMHVINLEDDSIVEFSTNNYVKQYVTKGHGCVEQMAAAMRGTVAAEHVDKVLEFTDLTTIQRRMTGKKCLANDFKGLHFKWFRAQFVTVETNEFNEPTILIFTTQPLDDVYPDSNMLKRTGVFDTMTGVPNRLAFEQLLELEKRKEKISFDGSVKLRTELDDILKDINGIEPSADNFGVLVLKIDNLHSVLKSNGRAAADELIWGAADVLGNVISKTEGRIYRITEDCFVTLFYLDEEATSKLPDSLNDQRSNWIGSNIRDIEFSYGIATHRDNYGLNLARLFEEAKKELLVTEE